MVWVSDITHVHDKDKLHSIGVIIDLYAQMSVAHKVSVTADVAFIQGVFDAAFGMRGLPEGLISHSDQGLQYIHRLFSENISLSASSPFRTKYGVPEVVRQFQKSPEPFGFEPLSDKLLIFSKLKERIKSRQSLSASSPFRTTSGERRASRSGQVARAFRLRALFGPGSESEKGRSSRAGRQSLSASSPFRTFPEDGKYKNCQKGRQSLSASSPFRTKTTRIGMLSGCESRQSLSASSPFRTTSTGSSRVRDRSRQSLSASSPFRTPISAHRRLR